MANNPKKIILYHDPQDDEAWVCEHVEYSSGIAWPGRVLLCAECGECANAVFVDESGQPVMAVDEPEGWREHILHGKPLPGKAAKAGKLAKPTTKKFRLLWSGSEWQLRPNTPAAYEEAEKKLIDNGWVDGIQAGKDSRDLFIFRGGRANVAVVLASLAAAGIPEADISVITKGMPPALGPLFQDAAVGRQ